MNFAENKFLIITAVVAVILAGGLVYYGMTISTAIEEEQMAERQSLMGKIEQFDRGTPANLATIEAKRLRVDKMKEQRQKVVETDVAFNRRVQDGTQAYVIPELTLKAAGGEKKPALPFVKEVWERNGLYFEFVEAYFKYLEGRLAALNLVTLPTEEEIRNEAVKIQKRLDRQQIRESRTTMVTPDAAPGPGGLRSTANASGEPSELAMSMATNQLRLAKAQQGRLYADLGSFDQMFVRGIMVPTLPTEQIWRAHLSMWVASDITDVIHQTIDDVYANENVPENQQNVLTSPVKRLLQITLEQTSTTRTAAAEMPIYEEDYSPRRGGRSRQPEAPMASRDMPQAATLSERASQPLYNVVRYSFTVIMPTRYVPVLQSKLVSLNYHTILNQDIAPVSATAEGTGVYYYGTEPVRQVTFTGELLLLSDWVRGTWDEDAETWTHLPLMPISVMQSELQPAQLRPTDQQLIEGRLPRPWDPSYTPPAEPTVRNRGR